MTSFLLLSSNKMSPYFTDKSKPLGNLVSWSLLKNQRVHLTITHSSDNPSNLVPVDHLEMTRG